MPQGYAHKGGQLRSSVIALTCPTTPNGLLEGMCFDRPRHEGRLDRAKCSSNFLIIPEIIFYVFRRYVEEDTLDTNSGEKRGEHSDCIKLHLHVIRRRVWS